MRLPLRTRILSAFVFSFAIFLGAMGYSISSLRALGADLRLVNEGYLPLAKLATRLESLQDRVDLDVVRLQRDGDRPLSSIRSNTDLHTRTMTSAVTRGLNTATSAMEQTRNLEEQKALQGVVKQLQHLLELQEAYVTTSQDWISRAGNLEPEEEQVLQAIIVLRQKEVQTAVKQLSATLDSSIRRVNVRIARTQRRAATTGGGLSVVALAFGLAMLAWTLLTLRPISRLTAEVQRVAAGDYSGRVVLQGQDEIGVLAGEFNTMARNLEERDRRLMERAEELNRLSRYLRSVLDTIRLGIVVVEEERITMVNPAASRMWEANDAEEGGSGDAGGGILPPRIADLHPGRHPALALGRQRFDIEVVPFGVNGRLLVGEDVTSRMLDRARLERSERLALIGQMLAQICHEIRNPLNAISLNTELLEDEIRHLDVNRESEAGEIVAIISEEILRLHGVTEHYLDLARRPAPSFQMEPPDQLLQSVCRLQEAAFERQGIQLVMKVPPGLPLILADRDQLRRALLNVLENAIHSQAHRVRVEVGVNEKGVYFQVIDDGQGMDLETMEHAFEPFFSTRSKGTGLGLAITRQIMEDHGGQAICRSSPGEGCEVILQMPRPPDETLI